MKTTINVLINAGSQGTHNFYKTFNELLPIPKEIASPAGTVPVINSIFNADAKTLIIQVIVKINESQLSQIKSSFNNLGWEK